MSYDYFKSSEVHALYKVFEVGNHGHVLAVCKDKTDVENIVEALNAPEDYENLFDPET